MSYEITRKRRLRDGKCIRCGVSPHVEGKQMCVNCAATAAAKARALRAGRNALGQCAVCTGPISPGEVTCRSCLDAYREQRKSYPAKSSSKPGYWDLVKSNRCVLCTLGLPDGSKKRMCAACAESRAKYESARYHALTKRGLCGRCGAINDTHRRVCQRCVRP